MKGSDTPSSKGPVVTSLGNSARGVDPSTLRMWDAQSKMKLILGDKTHYSVPLGMGTYRIQVINGAVSQD